MRAPSRLSHQAGRVGCQSGTVRCAYGARHWAYANPRCGWAGIFISFFVPFFVALIITKGTSQVSDRDGLSARCIPRHRRSRYHRRGLLLHQTCAHGADVGKAKRTRSLCRPARHGALGHAARAGPRPGRDSTRTPHAPCLSQFPLYLNLF